MTGHFNLRINFLLKIAKTHSIKNMKKLLYISTLFVAVFAINACKSDNKATTDLKTTIAALEDSIFTKEGGIKPLQEENGRKLTTAYEEYAVSGIPDSIAVEVLNKAAAIAKNVNGSYAKSIQLLQQIYTNYPESPRAADAEFMEAYTYNELQDYDTAQKLYNTFIQKHPKHPMYQTAILELQNLGKTNEMVLEEIIKMNK
jgi:tetratricopeptide (TPR) repeat protein